MNHADSHAGLVRCNTSDEMPAFLTHAFGVVMSGSPFIWWVEDASGALRFAFAIDHHADAFRLLDIHDQQTGVFADFGAAVRHGVTTSQRRFGA